MTEVWFHDRDDALDFAARFAAARVSRDEFSGEDDADDAAWVVEVGGDAPRVHEVAERVGGWVAGVEPPASSGVLDLPSGPRRFKNPRAPRPLPRSARRSEG